MHLNFCKVHGLKISEKDKLHLTVRTFSDERSLLVVILLDQFGMSSQQNRSRVTRHFMFDGVMSTIRIRNAKNSGDTVEQTL